MQSMVVGAFQVMRFESVDSPPPPSRLRRATSPASQGKMTGAWGRSRQFGVGYCS